MAVPASGTAPLNNPDHRAEHERINPTLAALPGGIVAYQMGAGAPGISTTAGIMFRLVNVPLRAGRCYLAAFFTRAVYFGATGAIHWYTGPQIRPVHTPLIFDVWMYSNAGAAYEHLYWEQQFTVDYDLTIPDLQVLADGPNGSLAYLELGGHFRIEDIGADTSRAW